MRRTRLARLTALFANLPVDGPTVRINLDRFRDEGYLTRQTGADIALLLSLPAPPDDEPAARRWLHSAGRLWPTAACIHGISREALRRLADLAQREADTLFDPPRLLTGEDVQALLGIRPGREVGRALDAVRSAQVDGTVRTREEAVALVRGLERP